MERTIILTNDGSHSIAIPAMNVTYHSIHGAIRESRHVFIDAGLRYLIEKANDRRINILEMGWGTGLNALLTIVETSGLQQPIHYTAIELFPLDNAAVKQLNYCSQLQIPGCPALFQKLHECDWEKDIAITNLFTLHKTNTNLLGYSTNVSFNLIYYDAFAPAAQPELWTKEIFEKLYSMLSPDGILVTYCSKGEVRRAMQAAGFTVEKIPGPPGKREMIRCFAPLAMTRSARNDALRSQ